MVLDIGGEMERIFRSGELRGMGTATVVADGYETVLDAEGYLLPGQRVRVPFRLNEADISSDVLLSEWPPQAFFFSVETPAGDVLDPATVTTLGGEFVVGNGVSYYRLPLPFGAGSGAHAGKWHAVIEARPDYERTPTNGLRYNLSVHSYSSIRLRAGLRQTGNAAGSVVTVRGTLTECGLPVDAERASILAEIELPDGGVTTLPLLETDDGDGVCEATFIADRQGVYPLRLRAKGISSRGRPFTREQLLTAAVCDKDDESRAGHPSHGDVTVSEVVR
jgi:hypothetical protein